MDCARLNSSQACCQSPAAANAIPRVHNVELRRSGRCSAESSTCCSIPVSNVNHKSAQRVTCKKLKPCSICAGFTPTTAARAAATAAADLIRFTLTAAASSFRYCEPRTRSYLLTAAAASVRAVSAAVVGETGALRVGTGSGRWST